MKKGKIESIGVGKKMHTSNQLKERLLKNIKNSNGITLIALIITIIVVVILAGVAISMTVRK